MVGGRGGGGGGGGGTGGGVLVTGPDGRIGEIGGAWLVVDGC